MQAFPRAATAGLVTGPWRRRDFRLIWGGGFVNDTGDWLLMVALPVYILTQTGSGVTTALLFIAQLAPAALLGPLAGNLVDRWDLRAHGGRQPTSPRRSPCCRCWR